MIKLICILLISTNLICADLYNQDGLNVALRNKLTYYNQTSSLSSRSDGGSNLQNTFIRKEYLNYIDANINNKFKISSAVGYYSNSGVYDKDKDMGEVYLSQDRSNIYIEKLYAQIMLAEIQDWKLSLAYGIIPLTGGNFKKYSTQDEVQGNGMFTLIDVNLQGEFIVLSNNNNIFKIGKAYWKKDNWQHDEKLIPADDNTEGTFAFYEYHSGKNTIELNYIGTNVKYYGQLMASAQMYGVGYSYDDSIENNIVYYGILGCSVWDSKMANVLDSGVFGASTNSIKYNNTNMPDKYGFNNGTYDGGSILVGTKYYSELFSLESDIGFEYFKTSKNYSSFNNGSLFYNDYGFWRRRGTNMYSVYSDIKLRKNLIFSTKASFVYNKYASKNGAVADTTELPLADDFYKTEKNILFKVTYEF